MAKYLKYLWIAPYLSMFILLSIVHYSVQAGVSLQIPTGSIPTVTSTLSNAYAIVTMEQDQINVRAGPNTDYPIVGILIAGQRVPALGRSVGGDWVQIVYPGVVGGVAWVYSPLVTIDGGLSVVEPPPTPTPKTTPTIDPTLAAQFIVEIPPTRLPTYTSPPPIVQPTFPTESTNQTNSKVPMGYLIIGLGIFGVFGMIVSLISRR
jgi:uncharacterized protein YraI